MSTVKIWIALIIVGLLLPVGAPAAGETASDAVDARSRLAEVIARNQGGGGQPGNLPQVESPLLPGGVELNAANRQKQQAAIDDYFTHIMESNRHQRRVFQWQLFSSKIIFVIVLVLVAAGIYFAAVQFHHGLRSGRTGTDSTEIEASLKGIKVSSPVLGVIILTLSLAFFYLYLVYVYPIEFVK